MPQLRDDGKSSEIEQKSSTVGGNVITTTNKLSSNVEQLSTPAVMLDNTVDPLVVDLENPTGVGFDQRIIQRPYT